MATRGGRRPGAGRKPGRQGERRSAVALVRDYEAGLLPGPFMLKELERFVGMKTEEGMKEARLIAVSIMPYFHPRLAAKSVSTTYDVGDKLDALLRAIDGRPGSIVKRLGRPALEAEQLILDHEQGRAEDAVQIELGSGETP